MDMKFPVEELTVEDMPTQIMRDVFECCGAEVAVKLLLYFSGSYVLIPTNGLKMLENKVIYKYYDGSAISIKRLARNLGTSETRIRSVLKNPPEKGQCQLDIFGENNGK